MRLSPNDVLNVLAMTRRNLPEYDEATLRHVEKSLLLMSRAEYQQMYESNAKYLLAFDKRLEKIGGRDE